jgi:hypothetical protein
MQTIKEAVGSVYENGKLIAIIKRDEESKKHLIYLITEAGFDDIVELIDRDKNVVLINGVDTDTKGSKIK